MIGAAPRDASWYDHPDVYSFKAVHADNGDMFAACNAGMILSESVHWPDATEVPEDVRCRRRACAIVFKRLDAEREARG